MGGIATFLWFIGWRRYRLDLFRQNLFALRDELFDMAATGDLAFNDPAYNVCYATARSALGPWTKGANNPVLSRTPDVSGPGHNCLIESPDGKELFCVYHVHKNKIPGGARVLPSNSSEPV